MEGISLKLELEQVASRVMNQYILRNEMLEKQMEAGIRRAIEEFDFEDEIFTATQKAIRDAIAGSKDWGKLRDLARKKADGIVDAYINRELDTLRDSLG